VLRGRPLALRMMADELNVSKETIRESSVKIYGRGRSAKSSSYRRADEQKQRRLASCQDFIQTCQDNPNFLYCIFLFPKIKTVLK
jgi:hypothetical protein